MNIVSSEITNIVNNEILSAINELCHNSISYDRFTKISHIIPDAIKYLKTPSIDMITYAIMIQPKNIKYAPHTSEFLHLAIQSGLQHFSKSYVDIMSTKSLMYLCDVKSNVLHGISKDITLKQYNDLLSVHSEYMEKFLKVLPPSAIMRILNRYPEYIENKNIPFHLMCGYLHVHDIKKISAKIVKILLINNFSDIQYLHKYEYFDNIYKLCRTKILENDNLIEYMPENAFTVNMCKFLTVSKIDRIKHIQPFPKVMNMLMTLKYNMHEYLPNVYVECKYVNDVKNINITGYYNFHTKHFKAEI